MDEILFDGRFLQMVKRGRWEFVQRKQASGVVVVVAKTRDQKWLLIEQRREPVGQMCVELPAGLSGDSAEFTGEELVEAARRELLEETGYVAGAMNHMGRCAPTPGLTSEVMDFFFATDIQQKEQGGGVGEEKICSHLIAEDDVLGWLQEKSSTHLISSMVYCGLYLAQQFQMHGSKHVGQSHG